MSKKIKIEITSWYTGKVLFEYEAVDNTVAMTLERAVKEKANLGYADLGYADLGYADLGYADLGYADLGSADLGYADLRYADLRSADLGSADLGYADLRYADLRSADLRSADLGYADLRYADLGYADLGYADLRYADLVGVKNLDSDHTDFWWHLHHSQLVEQLNEPLRARLNYIKKEKPKDEVELRLKLIKPVMGKIPTTQKAWNALHKKECGCGWNGKTIFTKKNGLVKDVA